MTQKETNSPKPGRRRRSRFVHGASQLTAALGTVGALFTVLLVIALAVYAGRREAARQVLTGWLENRGVEAEVAFERLDPDGLVASLRAGRADDPDLVVERVEIDYDLGAPWSGFSVRPTRIRLVRPRVRATLRDGEISFGALDPVIEDFVNRPPSPDRDGPLILIEDAQARLATAGGTLTAVGDGRIEDGRLVSADIGLPAQRLRTRDLSLDLTRGGVGVRAHDGRLAAAFTGEAASLAAGALGGERGQVRLVVEGPYPDTAVRRTDGPVRAGLDARFGAARWTGGEARGLTAELDFDGRANGWLDAFAFLGGLTGRIEAEGLSLGAAELTAMSATVNAERFRLSRREDLTWRFEGDAQVAGGAARSGDLSGRGVRIALSGLTAGGSAGATEARGRIGVSADAVSQGDLTLTGVTGGFDMDASFAGAGLVTLDGALRSSGGSWPVLGTPGPADAPEQAALKRAFQAFALDAPGLSVRTGTPGTAVMLTRPATIRPLAGGIVRISALPGQALYSAEAGRNGGGGLTLASDGGGLPRIAARVPRYVMANGLIDARLDGRASLDFGLARGVALSTAGRLTIGSGRTTFRADACSPFTADRLELGENDVTDVSAELCPGAGPTVVIQNGWRFEAEARSVSAAAPFLSMAVSEGRAAIAASDAGQGLTIGARVADARVADTETPARFHPVRGSGRIALAGGDWDGALEIRDRTLGRRVADLEIVHSDASGAGGVTIDATGIAFEPGGLQPTLLSPLAQRVSDSQATGEVDFTGALTWTPDGSASHGRFTTEGLDFVSPAGRVTRLAGTVDFISLAPLITAPDQTIRVERIEAFIPLATAEVRFELNAERLRVVNGSVQAAGGTVRLETTDIPLDPNSSYEGVLVLEAVQLGDLLSGSGLGESVRLDAVVSGRLPFVAGPNGVTIIEGRVHAVQPGRLSIARETLAGVQAEGGGEQVPPNAVQDFAYQALENLSFDRLEATLNSLPAGRLGVLFTIHGRHDPPVEQEIRLTLRELIEQRFMDSALPLPSGVEINLTLDSSFNLDQLIADLMEIQRARNLGRRSETVQPQGR